MAKYKYQVQVVSGHPLGFDILDAIVALANEGAVLDKESFNVSNLNFPGRAYLKLESDTVRENTANIRYILVEGSYTREELDAMKWDDLKGVCKAAGITGRDREIITSAYLEKVTS